MRKSREQKIQNWELLVKDRLASGMSVSQFCSENGFTENMYYHWVNMIHKADPDFDTRGGPVRNAAKTEPSFVEITPDLPEKRQEPIVPDTGIGMPAAAIQSGPVKIELYPNADAVFIRNLLEAVRHV